MANELAELKADVQRLRNRLQAMDEILDRVELRLSAFSDKTPLRVVRRETPLKRTLETLLQTTLEEFGMTREEFMGVAKYEYLVKARFLFSYAAAKQGIASCEIARFMGRDHSTVHNACKRAITVMGQEPALVLSYQRILHSVEQEVNIAS